MPTQVKTARRIYDDVIDFIAGGTTPESVIEFQLSDTAKARLEDLIYRSKTEQLGLLFEERRELENFLVVSHIMTMAKGKAYQIIKDREHDSPLEEK